jgi:hypothetical protein
MKQKASKKYLSLCTLFVLLTICISSCTTVKLEDAPVENRASSSIGEDREWIRGGDRPLRMGIIQVRDEKFNSINDYIQFHQFIYHNNCFFNRFKHI